MKTRNAVKLVRRIRIRGILASIAFALLALLLAQAAQAQPAGNEMCGDGTTFTVNLPGTSLGIDNSDGLFGGFFRNIVAPSVAPPDSITLPNGCSLYVLLVSGYHQNEQFDRIHFYKVAEFAAKNNGYVHVSWWNNLQKEYMGGLLHPVTVVIERFLLPDITIHPNPGGFDVIQSVGTLFPDNFLDLPKANPRTDEQFQGDAALMIQAIKANNPNALIIVAGHSMGGDAVARLGRNAALPIDLLAVIDPGNNRDLPVGFVGQRNFNWTRWRATHSFQGFKRWDCVRNSLGLCIDFDSRLFRVRFQCVPTGSFLSKPPLLATLAPIACPIFLAYADPGTRLGFGANIRHLYHRWQHEFIFPFDFPFTERFNFPALLSNSILDANYQQPILRNILGEGDPDKTCADDSAIDPRRGSPFKCGAFDGHGEIVGFRAPQGDLLNPKPDFELPGLGMQNWNVPSTAAFRRTRIIELATADATWPYRPTDPDTCMVCDDIITIISHLLAQQAPPAPSDVTAPFTVATAAPGPNVNGWNNEDVVITLNATDNAGGTGVKQIEHSVSGDSPAATVITAGSTAQETITAEGATTLSFFARDNASPENVEAVQSLLVQLDKTPPEINTVTDVQPNANGWNNTDVLVSFPASDALSGLAFSSPNVPVSTEGAAQDIPGTAEDSAGNQATAIATLNIDKTQPSITLASRTPAANAADWNNTDVTFAWDCADALSGPAAATDSKTISTEGALQMVIGTCMDLADNTATDMQSGINIDKTNPAISITTPPDGATYLLNAAVNSDFTCTDSLSGVASCTGTAASGAALNTLSVGDKQFTVNASDVADNHSTSTHNYAVHYVFSGFANPIGPIPMVNVAKAGRTVPIKYSLQDANSAFISDLTSFASLMSAPVACDSSAPGVLAEETDAAGSTTIRYDATSNQFIYNWKTDASWAGTCRALQLTLNDGTHHLVLFRFQ